MGTADDAPERSERLVEAFAVIAENLRRVTVQVQGRGLRSGSGVIWHLDGMIITNAHVARGPRAAVTLADGRMLEAEVTAKAPWLDLAMLTVRAADLPVAALGNSHALRVGELVLAIGNPLGVPGALTAGIVHGVGPTVAPGGPRWVQADIRLAPGNSGGPLANAQGRVIGVNSMIAGGLALAVPSHLVERFVRRHQERPYAGVTTRPVLVTPGCRCLLGLVVLEVAPGSPAEAAGILLGDVLIGVAGRLFATPDDLAEAVDNASPGDALALDLIRGGVHRSCAVVVRVGTFAAEAA